MWTGTPTGRLSVPELCLRGRVHSRDEAFPQLSFGSHFGLPSLQPGLGISQVLLCARTCLLAKVDSAAEVYAWSIS